MQGWIADHFKLSCWIAVLSLDWCMFEFAGVAAGQLLMVTVAGAILIYVISSPPPNLPPYAQ